MAKSNTSETTTAPESAPILLSITDFCTRLSETVSRPELIGAFAAVEQRAGRVSDTAEKFRSRFGAFINQPV